MTFILTAEKRIYTVCTVYVFFFLFLNCAVVDYLCVATSVRSE